MGLRRLTKKKTFAVEAQIPWLLQWAFPSLRSSSLSQNSSNHHWRCEGVRGVTFISQGGEHLSLPPSHTKPYEVLFTTGHFGCSLSTLFTLPPSPLLHRNPMRLCLKAQPALYHPLSDGALEQVPIQAGKLLCRESAPTPDRSTHENND